MDIAVAVEVAAGLAVQEQVQELVAGKLELAVEEQEPEVHQQTCS